MTIVEFDAPSPLTVNHLPKRCSWPNPATNSSVSMPVVFTVTDLPFALGVALSVFAAGSETGVFAHEAVSKKPPGEGRN